MAGPMTSKKMYFNRLGILCVNPVLKCMWQMITLQWKYMQFNIFDKPFRINQEKVGDWFITFVSLSKFALISEKINYTKIIFLLVVFSEKLVEVDITLETIKLHASFRT